MPTDPLHEELRDLNRTLKKLSRLESFPFTFLRGVIQGLGSVVGATIVVGLLVYIISNIQIVPIIGVWLADIIKQVQVNLMYK